MAFTGVTNAHGPSPQPTACSLTTAIVTRPKARFKPTLPENSWVETHAIDFKQLYSDQIL